MKRAIRHITLAVLAASLALALVLAAGCSANKNFVYKPNPPAADARMLPVKVAVLPFEDGTENFTFRGSVFSDGQYNLGKAGVAGGMDALPPEIWGKSFADDLAASGNFRSARFVYGRSEVKEEDFLVEGTLKKANFAATWRYTNDILASFRATRLSDGKRIWEKEAGISWNDRPEVSPACSLSMNCVVGKLHEDWNRRMNAVLAEARTDFVAALAALREAGPGQSAGPNAARPAGQPVDRTIENILKGK